MSEPMEQEWHRDVLFVKAENGYIIEGSPQVEVLDRIVSDHNFALLRAEIVALVKLLWSSRCPSREKIADLLARIKKAGE